MRIHDHLSTLHAGAAAPAVDGAPQRRRPPALRRADELLARGLLGAQHIDVLAERLASLHAEARSDAETAASGAPGALERRVEEVVVRARGVAGEADHVAEATHWLRAFARGHARLFEERAARGRVREVQGTLRLRDVWFDSERVRAAVARAASSGACASADACCDVADLASDLAVAGRPDLAERLLAQYLAASDDYQLLAVFPFYTALRALERCVGTNHGDPQAWLAVSALVERARRAAVSVTAVPALIVVGGCASDLRKAAAEAAAAALTAPRIRIETLLHDVPRAHEGGAALAPAPSGGASAPVTDVYAAALERAALVLASGRACVLEGGFRSGEMRAAARAVAQVGNAGFRFVDCQPSSFEAAPAEPSWPQPFMSVPTGTTELSEHERIVLGGEVPPERALGELRAALRPWRRTGAES
jgi:hypothetical protein